MRGKSKFKIISIITIVSILLTLIPIRNIIIKAENKSDPSFSIDKMTAKPYSSILGDDITISGLIQPEEFEVQTVEQELVIVLDVSKKENKTENGNNLNKIINPLENILKKFPNKNSIKLGIIAYSNESKILQNENRKLASVNDFRNWNDWTNFNQIINNSKTNKNIGDALRQAIYILDSSESNPNANKTILLIAEGKTDTRRVDGDGNFYLDTTKERGENTTQIVTDDEEKGAEYAKVVGNIIKNKGYNVFTVGFDIDKKDSEKAEKQKNVLRQIHSSMTGYNDLNDTNCEEKGLFLETRNPSDNGDDINRILTKVFDKFSGEYYLNNVSLNFEFDNDITLKSGENSIKLENIKYTLDENSKTYKAEPIKFSFIIKAKNIGEQKVFENLSINYSWKNKNQVQDLTNDLSITVERNDLPNIVSTLISNENPKVNVNDKMTLEYKITPKEALFNNFSFITEEISDVIIISDLSENMKNQQRDKFLQNGVYGNQNGIESEKGLVYNLKNININFGIIGYNENYYIGDISKEIINNRFYCIKKNVSDEKLISPLFNLGNNDKKEIFRILFQEDSYLRSNISTNTRNIDNALIKAKSIFDKFTMKGKRKAIILINSGEVSYSENIAEIIKKENYKIISLDISNDIKSSYNLKKLHEDLGGVFNINEIKSDYIKGTSDGQNYNFVGSDMKKVADRINGGIVNNSYDITPKFTFDLNNSFEYLEASNDNISLLSNKDNKLEFDLNNPVEYKYSGEMVNGKYKFIADEQTISFKVKVKDSKLSNLTFGSNTKYLSNYMSYKNFSKEEVKVALTTPEVTLIQKVSNVSHGLYNGIVNNKVDIKENTIINGENNSLKLSEKSTLVMGSTFNTSSNGIEVFLDIDNNFEGVKASDIIVYKVINNNEVETIERVGERENSGNYTVDYVDGQTNKFKISINDFNDKNEDTKILIVYKGTIKDNISNEMLTNKIEFGNGPYKDFSIKVNKEINTDTEKSPKLPDLF